MGVHGVAGSAPIRLLLAGVAVRLALEAHAVLVVVVADLARAAVRGLRFVVAECYILVEALVALVTLVLAALTRVVAVLAHLALTVLATRAVDACVLLSKYLLWATRETEGGTETLHAGAGAC